MDKIHGKFNKSRKKLTKFPRKRVFLVSVATKTKEPVSPFRLIAKSESPVQTVKGTQIKRMRSVGKSLSQRYLEEKCQ